MNSGSCKMKRLSVIVPGFNNSEAWWRRSVASVMAACGPDDEIICVDDGSVIPVEMGWLGCENDNRVKLVRKGNGGLADARNAGMKIAKGEYVTFVDSDYEVGPEIYAKSLDVIKMTDSDIVIFGVRTIWPEDGLQKIDSFRDNKNLGKLSPADILELGRKCLLNYAWNKIYKHSFLLQKGILFDKDGMPCEDIMFNLSCIMSGAQFGVVACVGYNYYRTRGTLLSRYKPTSHVGTRLAREMWRRYKAITKGAREVLGDFGEVSRQQEIFAEWRNIWMPGTPFSLGGRWKWLKEHPEVGGAIAFLKMLFWTFLRRHFYFRPIRRWHTKRLYPSAEKWSAIER